MPPATVTQPARLEAGGDAEVRQQVIGDIVFAARQPGGLVVLGLAVVGTTRGTRESAGGIGAVAGLFRHHAAGTDQMSTHGDRRTEVRTYPVAATDVLFLFL